MKELLVVLAAALAVVSRPYAQSATQVFHPTDDARVSETYPTKSYGTDPVLRIRGTVGGAYRTFFRFVLPEVAQTVQTVKLRLYCTDGSSDGGTVYARLGSSSSWGESNITWANQPPLPTNPAATIGAVSPNTWVEFDITRAMNGPGTYVIGITSSSSNSAYYAARESLRPPEIVLGFTGGSGGGGTPVADFTAAPLSGQSPLQVVFTDTTTQGPTSWLWSFGDGGTSTLRNPVHIYQSPGTYTVSLVATGPAGTASKTKPDLVRVFADDVEGIWTSARELAQLPMSGSAWNSLLAEANRPLGVPMIANQDDLTDQRVLAKALVYARTGTESYRTQVIDACQRAMGTEVGGITLALGRNLGPYVIAADLVGLPQPLDAHFRTWLRKSLTENLQGRTLVSTHESRPNNWGTHAGGSRAAVAAYLGDKKELERCARVFKGWLGDRSSYAAFEWGDLSWQADPAHPVGINPRGAMKNGHSIDGVLPDDQRRTAGGFVWPPPKENYVWEALQGALMQAVILHRAGYDVWNWEDQALLRAVNWLHQQCAFPATGDDTWLPHLVNRFYAASFPAPVPSSPGKNMGWTDWTHR